jgi:protein O-GlcNAc transferase
VTRTTTLEIVAGVRVVVPDSLNLLTPYVLLEQRDWFEDEMGFVRRLLRPGEQAIDVGANYGVYTLTMAKMVGPTGAVWAFEPAAGTAALLAQGIAANNFNQVTLECCAISDTCGTAQLTLNDNAEFNTLVRGNASAAATETVRVVTLDDCLDRYAWKDIAFVKIDAEGEEAAIINGGRRFLTETSPLLLYEVKAGSELHLDLVRLFGGFGFDSYRLVPGLNLLVPFDAESETDGFLLNLFCCKKDRAALLAERGLLLDAATIEVAAAEKRFERFYDSHREEFTWDRRLATTPYGGTLAEFWATKTPTADSLVVDDALACYAVSRDTGLTSIDRFNALQASFHLLQSLCKESPKYLRLASLTRVARDYGARAVAENAIMQFVSSITRGNPPDPTEPFLAPGTRFDSVSPDGRMGDWILAAGAEEFERLCSFSSFYTGESALPRLELIASLGFASEEMDRRLTMVQSRFGAATDPHKPP